MIGQVDEGARAQHTHTALFYISGLGFGHSRLCSCPAPGQLHPSAAATTTAQALIIDKKFCTIIIEIFLRLSRAAAAAVFM